LKREGVYDLILMEASHRNLNEEPPDIDALSEEEKNESDEGAAEMIPPPGNSLPLIIVDNPEDAQPFFKALNEAKIPYTIQIMVEAEDYEQADNIASNLQLQKE